MSRLDRRMREVDADLDYYESVYKRLVAEVGEQLDDLIHHRNKIEARGNRHAKKVAKEAANGGDESVSLADLAPLVETGRLDRSQAEAAVLATLSGRKADG